MFLYHRDLGTQIGHSASFSWDGEVLIFGHEPGGGTQARCQASSSVLDRTLFFLDADTGATLAEFLHPRPQRVTENCTWHNYNVVPLRDSDDKVLVAGNYQSGISVVDFSDPEDPEEIAFADPAPLVDPNHAGRHRGRRRLVELLVRRVHLRGRHDAGPDHLEAQ